MIFKKLKLKKFSKISNGFRTGVKNCEVENCWMTTELNLVGGQVDRCTASKTSPHLT
jgi:hypothetical protein